MTLNLIEGDWIRLRQILTQLSGVAIQWAGEFASNPANPATNTIYRNTTDGKVYIWNGAAWSIMLDSISGIPGPTGPAGPTGSTGATGADGNSVWITYHAADLVSAPSDPTGDGESGGWTKTPSFVPNWMSLKISATVSVGTWGNPMAIRGVPGTYVIPDCVARYKLDENDANTAVYDSSGNGFNGAADANTSVLHQSGVFGGCLSFDGFSQNIDCGDVPAFSFTGPFTVSHWVRLDAIDRAQILLHKNLSSYANYSVSVQADNKVKFQIGTGSANVSVVSGRTLTTDTWYHICGVYDGTTAYLFIDGVLENSASISVMASTAGANLFLGGTSGYFFDGMMDHVMLFSRALAYPEVIRLYDRSSPVAIEADLTSGNSPDVPVLRGITFKNNGSGTATWDSGTIRYQGMTYSIAANSAGTDMMFIYWNPSIGTSLSYTNNEATAMNIAAGNFLVCLNRDNKCYPVSAFMTAVIAYLQVVKLSAINADIGTITGGSIVLTNGTNLTRWKLDSDGLYGSWRATTGDAWGDWKAVAKIVDGKTVAAFDSYTSGDNIAGIYTPQVTSRTSQLTQSETAITTTPTDYETGNIQISDAIQDIQWNLQFKGQFLSVTATYVITPYLKDSAGSKAWTGESKSFTVSAYSGYSDYVGVVFNAKPYLEGLALNTNFKAGFTVHRASTGTGSGYIQGDILKGNIGQQSIKKT